MENAAVGYLTKSGFIVPDQTLRIRFGKKYSLFLSKLTILHPQKIGPPKKLNMYSRVTYNNVQCLLLPRTYSQLLIKTKILQQVVVDLAEFRQIEAKLQLDLYDNQKIIVDWLMDNIFTQDRMKNGSATCILNLRAGNGKSFVAGGLIPRIGGRTLYVTTKCPLASQAVKDLRACLCDDTLLNCGEGMAKKVIVGRYGKKIPKNNKKAIGSADLSLDTSKQDVTVIVVNSALALGEEFFSSYSFIVLDEVHTYCTEKRRAIFNKCSANCVIGLSATTSDRTDGFDVVSHKELAFDGVINALNIPGFEYSADTEFDCTARIINYYGPPEHTQHLTHESTGYLFTHYMHNQFIGDPYRLKVAIDELVTLYDWRGPEMQTHFIYVWAEEIGILKVAMEKFKATLASRARNDIAENIDAPELMDQKHLGLFVGGLKEKETANIADQSRVLFATCGFAGTGISIPKMTAMIMLTPRKAAMMQIFPRILRRGSDLSVPRVIVDFVDKKTALKGQFRYRIPAYDFYGFKREEIAIHWEDINL